MLLYLSVVSIFILAIFSTFVLVKVWHKKELIFLLAPFIVAAGAIGGYSVNALRGTAIDALPVGEVQMLTATIQKPKMHIVVKHLDTGLIKLYTIPYTKRNATTMNRLKKESGEGKAVRGEFMQPNGGDNVEYRPLKITPPESKSE